LVSANYRILDSEQTKVVGGLSENDSNGKRLLNPAQGNIFKGRKE